MSYAMANELVAPNARRPRPGPGTPRVATHRVAPPVEEAYGPWVTILEQPETAGELRWSIGPDGVMLPARGAANAESGRGALLGRLAALVRR